MGNAPAPQHALLRPLHSSPLTVPDDCSCYPLCPHEVCCPSAPKFRPTESATMTSKGSPSYAIPVSSRPPLTPLQWLHTASFNAVFQTSMLALHAVQLFIIFPFRIHPSTMHVYNTLATWTKGLFGQLLVFISMVWAPTVLRVYTDLDDDELDLNKIVHRDDNGVPIGLDLPERTVMMSNHQVYCDWSYIWDLLYFANLHQSVVIILKASLKWVPLVGPAMQVFRFIFMKRNWGADKVGLGKALKKMGQHARRSMDPFVLLIFPGGTLVSPLTRPVSKKYADKVGIPDGVHTLLPRSTGLLFCLRSLAPRVPELRLLDATIAYPGIPGRGYGQDYYTLQSIFGAGVPPPVIHIHLRSYLVKHDLPIGQSTMSESATTGSASTPEQRKEFDEWVLKQWRLKDERLEAFTTKGTLQAEAGTKTQFVDIPVKLRSTSDLVVLLAAIIAGLWLIKAVCKLLWRLI